MKNIYDLYEGLLQGQETTLSHDITDLLWDLLCVNPNTKNCKKGYEMIEAFLKKDGVLTTRKENKWGAIKPAGPKSLIQLHYSKELISGKTWPESIKIYDGKTKKVISLTPFSPINKEYLYDKNDRWYIFSRAYEVPVYEVPDSLQPFINKISEFIKTI